MKCPNCGADIPADASVCSFCGSAKRSAETKDGANLSNAAIFDKLKASPEYDRRESSERVARLPKISGAHKAIGLIFPIMFIGVSGFIALMALGMSGVVGVFGFKAGGPGGVAFSNIPAIMAVVPIGFVVFGVFLFLRTKKRLASFENDPVESIPVLVVDKRTHVWGGSGDSSAQTHYYVTCEAEDGRREEYQVWDGRLYGTMSADDAGILFMRAGYCLDFDRVAV